ncbi:MAG: molecular chaperone HtpG, partial [Firmicutes bacterium]|nr:molecular chaperone HtpG [Bacillota bacterium]
MSVQEKGNLSINSENLFPIIKKWLYSDQDIFIRELVSNAVDAIQKFKHLVSLGEAEAESNDYRVTIHLDPEAKTITISDNGLG